MKKIYLSIFLLTLMFFNCESPTEYAADFQEFFPLKVGNKWYYRTNSTDTSNFNETIEIIGQKKLNDNIYFETVVNMIDRNFIDTFYYRFAGNALVTQSPPQNERILADFSLKLNQYAYWDSVGDLSVSEKTDSIITFSRPFHIEYGSSITYKKGIGLIKSFTNGFIVHLRILVRADIK